MNGVFDTRAGTVYDDDIASRYHFPDRYLRAALSCLGNWILYSEPRRNGGRSGYVAIERVVRGGAGPSRAGHSYARLEGYLEHQLMLEVSVAVCSGNVTSGIPFMSGGPRGGDWQDIGRPSPPVPTGGSGGGGGGGGDVDPCDIVSDTNLNSPVQQVIRTLRPGDVLNVHLDPGPPRVLQARTGSGHVAGSITSRELPRIIDCIQQGVIYVADVLSIAGGICQVRVHR